MEMIKETIKHLLIDNLEPVAKLGWFCTGSCSFSAYGLRNVLFSAVAVAKLQAHPVLPGEIATASLFNYILFQKNLHKKNGTCAFRREGPDSAVWLALPGPIGQKHLLFYPL
jgi:hypothetical protein